MDRTAVSASPALRLVPSGRSLAVGFALLGVSFALFFAARQTGVFAVHEVEIESIPPGQSRVVARALRDLEGLSLLKVDGDVIQRRLDDLPHVHLLAYDRAFPNRLTVRVSVERPAAVLRQGGDRWLVSAEGRVLRVLERPLRRPLPVVWVDRTVEPEVGSILTASEPARAIRAIATIRTAAPGLARRVWYVKPGDASSLTAVLADGFEIRLGPAVDLALKAEVARNVLAVVRREGALGAYLDVSVPSRPVFGETLESQVEAESSPEQTALTGQ